MPGTLSDDQIDEFATRGFLVLRDVIPPDVLAAANRSVDEHVGWNPPGPEVRGNHFYFPESANEPDLIAPLTDTAAFAHAEGLTGPGTLEEPWQIQISLNIPPFPHRPGQPHIDGDSLNFPRSRPPGTFTILAGVLLTDQTTENSGNLWVWPGTHLAHAEFFRANGPDAFSAYPDVPLPEPEQILGRTGDLLLAHFLLGHNIGGNFESNQVRRALYYRIKRKGHNEPVERWREFLQDPWLDYDVVRARLESGAEAGATAAG